MFIAVPTGSTVFSVRGLPLWLSSPIVTVIFASAIAATAAKTSIVMIDNVIFLLFIVWPSPSMEVGFALYIRLRNIAIENCYRAIGNCAIHAAFF
jgi:hypothetical protein